MGSAGVEPVSAFNRCRRHLSHPGGPSHGRGSSRALPRLRGSVHGVAAPCSRVVVCLVLLAACARSGPVDAPSSRASRPAVQFGELEVDGHRRTYRVFAPRTIEQDAPAALLLALHDAFGSAESFRQTTQFDDAATAGNFVVVYPESHAGTWNGGFCCGRAAQEDVDDVGFLTRVLDEVLTNYPIDPARVFAAGASNGAIMAYRLGCDLASRVTGVASVGGAMVMDDCAPRQPVSVLALHGTEDGHVPYQGGLTSGGPVPVPSQPDLLARWAELSGCAETAGVETHGVVRTSTWERCRAGRSVRLLTIEGGGHTWFSPEFGGPAGAVDATAEISDFFDLTPRGS